MDVSDSRKRPLDGEHEVGVTKRSNQGAGADSLHLKLLIPAMAAGAIIGKGGETITQIQRENGANVKMSKANDFYPGTSERVCLITGSFDSVRNVHEFIMDKIHEKPESISKSMEGGDTKGNFERHKQVKILVPNSTAGMIIGKAGNFIRQIKEESGAYVQISQKAKDMNLPERCVTIAGDLEQNRLAMDLILRKLLEDPQSTSCPTISYADYHGPIASANPTGSPFANSAVQRGMEFGMGGAVAAGANVPFGNIGNGMNNLNLNANANMGGSALDNLRATLRGSGYSEPATDEISGAMYTLANYGFLGMGLGFAPGMQAMAGGGGAAAYGAGFMAAQSGNLTLGNLAGILGGGGAAGNGNVNAGSAQGGSLLANSQPNNSGGGGGDNKLSVFGPVGNTTTTMAGGDTGEAAGNFFATANAMTTGEHYSEPNSGDNLFGNGANFQAGFNAGGAGGPGGTNENSFGLGTGMAAFAETDDGTAGEKELEVGEHIVGAILGPGGRGIVDLQKFTGANIQISKKGVYAPGTQNRIVTISGQPVSVQRANMLIKQRIVQEQAKRARQNPR